MLIACLVELAASDEGFTLLELVEATGLYSFDPPHNPRFACIKLADPTGGGLIFLVPRTGAYTAAANIPEQYGYDFAVEGTMFEMAYPQNSISLQEIIVGGAAGEQLLVWGYQI